MIVDPRTGLLDVARQCPSPNRDARPDPDDIGLVVIHGISLPPGEFGGDAIDRLFTNSLQPDAHPYFAEIAGLRVSSHLLIRRDGGIVQYVPFHERAWHAGRSCWAGREECNDFAIGIELEGTDDTPYTDAQYSTLARVVGALATAYPALTQQRLAGHCDIAPGRKTDPGPAFDWERLASLLPSAAAPPGERNA
jgi:AmpD protein